MQDGAMGELLPHELNMYAEPLGERGGTSGRPPYAATVVRDTSAGGLSVPGAGSGAQTGLVGADAPLKQTLSVTSITEAVTEDRETWGKKVDFLLSVIGFAVDLSNIWRFPHLCYQNGGGVFLIPYTLMYLIAGVPLFYMELALGQYYRQGAISCWGKVCPLFKGKVVWFTAVFPYIVLFFLFLRGITLPGAIDGIKFYLKPDMSKLWQGDVWLEAATQVFFSLGPGFGVLLAFASYNPFHNNIYMDAMFTSAINGLTSFVSGFVIFSVLGYMACRAGLDIKDVAQPGTGLVFVVYPEALSTMPGGPIWSVLFFLMLLTLGLDSSFGGSEAIVTALSDEFPILRRNREIFLAMLFSLYFVIGIGMCTQGGYIIEEWIGYYCAKYGLVLAVLCETMVIAHIYGYRRFSDDINEMLGFRPGYYWILAWTCLAPIFLLFNFFFGIYYNKPLVISDKQDLDYHTPEWFLSLGNALAFSSAVTIPLMAAYQLIIAPGNTFKEKLRHTITPWKDTPAAARFRQKQSEIAAAGGAGKGFNASAGQPLVPGGNPLAKGTPTTGTQSHHTAEEVFL